MRIPLYNLLQWRLLIRHNNISIRNLNIPPPGNPTGKSHWVTPLSISYSEFLDNYNYENFIPPTKLVVRCLCQHPLWTYYVLGVFYISSNLRIKIRYLIITGKILCLPSVEFKHTAQNVWRPGFGTSVLQRTVVSWQLGQIPHHLSYMVSNSPPQYRH